MPTVLPFRRRTLATLVAAACGSLPAVGHAAARAGQVDFAVGNVVATGGDGAQREIRKGATIQVGDTIETNRGRAWLRFKDGGYMSLQPGSEFRVDDYRFEGEEDGNERSFFSLLKGGVRAITGVIGKRNRNSYRVNTPVATIGIRGTEYLAQLGNSLTVSCGAGICVVTNDAGETVLQAGQTVYFADRETPGRRTTRKVVLPPNAPVVFSGGEFRDADGDLSVVPDPAIEPPEEEQIFSNDVPLVPGQDNQGLFLAYTYSGDGGEFGQQADTFVESGVAPQYVVSTLNGNLQLERADWTDDPNAMMPDENLIRLGGNFADTNTDGIIAWGRWTNGQTAGTDIQPFSPVNQNDGNESTHWFTGAPTPESDLLQLKALGAAAVYNIIGATEPTFGDDGFEGSADFGNIVQISGAMAANFADSTVSTSLELDFTNNDVSIAANGIPMQAGPGGVFSAVGPFATSTLNMSAVYNTQIKGFLAGSAANRAGYAYDVFVDGFPAYTIHGAAAFKQGAPANPVIFDVPL